MWQYVWKEWFKAVEDVMVDPRCQIPPETVYKRLETLPIQQAVLPDPWNVEQLARGQRPKFRLRLKLGFDPDLAALRHGAMHKMFFRLNGLTPEETLAGVKRHICDKYEKGIGRYTRFSLELGTPISFYLWQHRVQVHGWNIYSAAFQDFWFILYGRKYKTPQKILEDYPWLTKHYLRDIEKNVLF